MATAQETVVNVIPINSEANPPNQVPGTVVYTVPVGKYAEVFVNYVRTRNANGGIITVGVGDAEWPGPPTQDSTVSFGSTGTFTKVVTTDPFPMNAQPIILHAGQTIRHIRNGSAGGNSKIVATVKEYNAP